MGIKKIDLQIMYFPGDQKQNGPRLVCSATDSLLKQRAVLVVQVHQYDTPSAGLLWWQDFREGVLCGWWNSHGKATDYPWYTAKIRNKVARHAENFYKHWSAFGPIGVLHARNALAMKHRDVLEGYRQRALIAFDDTNHDHELHHVDSELQTATDRFEQSSDAYHDAAHLCPCRFTHNVDRGRHDEDVEGMELVTDDVVGVKA